MLADQSGLRIGSVSLASKLDDNFNFLELTCKMIFIVLGSSSINSTTFGCVLIRVLARILFWGMIMINTKLRLSVMKIMALVFGLMLMFFFSNCSKSSDQTNQQGNITLSDMTSLAGSTVMEGKLEIVIEDDFKHNTSRTRHFLKTENTRIELRIKNSSTAFVSDQRVRVSGTKSAPIAGDGNVAIIQNAEISLLSPVKTLASGLSPMMAASSIPYTTGPQHTLVLLYNLDTNPVEPFSIAAVQSKIFGEVNNYFKEASYNQTSLYGDVFGWYTIDSANCKALSSYHDCAKNLAMAAGVNVSAYSRIIYLSSKRADSPASGGACLGCYPSWTEVLGNSINEIYLYTVVHELGHNFGLDHSHSLICGSAVIGNDCLSFEYGDSADAMGPHSGALGPGHFNAFQKERLGWLNSGSSPPVTEVLTSGTFTLDTFETMGTAAKALKVLKSTDPVTGLRSWYYVEYRSPYGFDNFLASLNTGSYNQFSMGNYTKGVLIHTGVDGDRNSSHLLDMKPSPADGAYSEPVYNEALEAGKKFIDGDRGISINTISVGGAATVSVSFGAPVCVSVSPVLSVSPPDGTMGLMPGTQGSYQVLIKNSDNSICANSIYDLSLGTLPNGWAANFSNSSVQLAPGASTMVTLNLTSPVSALSGTQAFSVKATNRLSPIYSSGSNTFQYKVSTSAICETRNPGVVVNPTFPAAVAPGAAVTYAVAMVNMNSSACGATNYPLKVYYLGGGLTAEFSPASLTLSPGAVGFSTLTITSSPSSFPGSFNMVVGNLVTLSNYYDAPGVLISFTVGSVPPPAVDATVPVVKIISPVADSTVIRNKATTITATATDNVAVTKVEFYVNGTLLCSVASPGYSCLWKVPGKRGSYTIKAVAYDAVGNAASAISIVNAK